MDIDMSKYPYPLTTSSGFAMKYSSTPTVYIADATSDPRSLDQIIRSIVCEELERHLDEVKRSQALEGKSSITIDFTYEGKRYKGTAYEVEDE
jgi:hypothetical protein